MNAALGLLLILLLLLLQSFLYFSSSHLIISLPPGLPLLLASDTRFPLCPALRFLLTTYFSSYSYGHHLLGPSLPGLSPIQPPSIQDSFPSWPLCTSHVCYHDNWQNQRAINVMADGSCYVKLTTVRFTPLFIKAQGLNYCQIEKSYVR